MRVGRAVLPVLIGFLAAASPALADSVSVTSGPNGTTVTNKPCRVVTRHGDGGTASNSTSITSGPNGLSGNTTVSPGGAGTSVTVGSGASSDGTQSSAAAGSDCVIYRDEPSR